MAGCHIELYPASIRLIQGIRHFAGQMNQTRISKWIVILSLLLAISCKKDEPPVVSNNNSSKLVDKNSLPIRSGARPETTMGIPHVQIDVEPVPEVHEEMIRRIYSIPGIDDQPSVVASWRGLWISEDLAVVEPDALIGGREFAHIHTDGSLHLFLDRRRANEAVETAWAAFHPYAIQGLDGWEGFVMLYTPQSLEELDVTFQLIVEGYNNVTGQIILATDYYD